MYEGNTNRWGQFYWQSKCVVWSRRHGLLAENWYVKQGNLFGPPWLRTINYDSHRAQTTEKVNNILQQECNMTLALVPPGAISKVQSLQVIFNAAFTKAVSQIGHWTLSFKPWAVCWHFRQLANSIHQMGRKGMTGHLLPTKGHCGMFFC